MLFLFSVPSQTIPTNARAFLQPSIAGASPCSKMCRFMVSLGPGLAAWVQPRRRIHGILTRSFGWSSLCASVLRIHTIEMSGIRANSSRVASLLVLISLLIAASSPRCVWCVGEDEYSKSGNPAVLPIVTSLIYNQILNLTKIFNKEIASTLSFCTRDVWVEFEKLDLFTALLMCFLANLIEVFSLSQGSWSGWGIPVREQLGVS